MVVAILIITVFLIIDTVLIYTLIKQAELIESMQANLDISETEVAKQIEFAGKVQEENASLKEANINLERKLAELKRGDTND